MTGTANTLKDKRNYDYLVILFIVIFISDDTFTFGTNQNFGYILFKYGIYFFLTSYLLVRNKLKIYLIPTKGNLALCAIGISVLLTAVLNFDLTGGYIYQIWLALLAFLITQYIPSRELARIFIKYIYVLSLISIVVFIIANSFPNFLTLFPVYLNANDVEFYNLGICVVFKDIEEVRNTGIFREPGVFMVYLSLAIILELFHQHHVNRKHIIVLIIASVLTFSTAAFIILAVICIAYLFKSNHKEVLKNKFLILMAGISIVMAIISIPELYSRVFDKIGKDSVNEGSSLARGASVIVNLKMFSDHPIKGIGITSFPGNFESYSLDMFGIALEVGNNTNTITTIMAVYGVAFSIVFIYLILMSTGKLSKYIIIRFFLFIAFLMMLSNEDLRYSLMTFVILFWGLKSELTKEVLDTEPGIKYA